MKKHNLSFLQGFVQLCFILSFFLFSCSDDKKDIGNNDGNEPPPVITTTPTILQQFENALDKSLMISDIKATGATTTLTLSDKSTIELPIKYYIIDFTGKEIPVVTKGLTNTWVVNGTNLGIPVKTSSSGDPLIVCIAYDNNAATIYLNDGERKIINREGEEGIYSFILEAAKNNELDKDIIAVIEGNSISAILPEGVSAKSLILSFGYRGASVTVNGTAQESGKTANNFETPLTYSLKKKDGTKIDYLVNIRSVRIPQIYIDTENNAEIKDKENYVKANIRVEDPSKLYTDGTTVERSAGIRGRGNSTWGMPKKPYRIKLDKKAQLLGMSTDKDWALLANYADKSLLRNITAFNISRIVGMRWTPKSISVEVYLNGKYLGVYALTEHVKVSEERLNINLADKSVDGDYLMELDFHYDEGARFKTDIKKLPMMFKDPDEPTDEQFNFVKDFYNKAESVLYSDKFTDPENGYHKYIDIESFVKYFIVQELAKNCDGNMRGSCYMAVLGNNIIEQPLVWDFDIAFGNANHITTEQGASSTGPKGWYIKTCSPWFDQLFKDPAFVKALKEKWNTVKPQLDQLPQFVQNHSNELESAAARNFGKIEDGGAGWDIHKVMWPNYIDRGSYEKEVKFLKDFIEQRLVWLDKYINEL